MQGNDLSNESQLRLLVTYEAITDEVVIPKKVLGVVTGTKLERIPNMSVLSQFWRFTDKVPLRLELVHYGVTQKEADRRQDALDTKGTNPFNYSLAYESLEVLLAELPYRNDVIGILDVPENQARYGLAGVGINFLDRIF